MVTSLKESLYLSQHNLSHVITGELYFEAYLSALSCRVRLLITDAMRVKLVKSADPVLEPDITDSELDGRVLLPYVVDRLVLSPSLSQQLPQDKNAWSIPLRDKAEVHKPYLSIEPQGLRLRLRLNKQAGRQLTRIIMNFLGVPHVISIGKKLC